MVERCRKVRSSVHVDMDANMPLSCEVFNVLMFRGHEANMHVSQKIAVMRVPEVFSEMIKLSCLGL